MRIFGIVTIAFLALPTAWAQAGDAPEKYPVTTPPGGIESPYTQILAQTLAHWPPKELGDLAADSLPVQIEALQKPDNSLYIGALQHMTVNAPLAAVVKILDDFGDYPKIFDGLIKCEVRARDSNRLLTFWEQDIPVPFVPNEKNEMIYLVHTPDPTRKIYRYQLKSSNHLKTNDGMIVLQALGDAKTDYTEYDFWDADWGLAKAFGHDRIWRENLEGIYQSDLAIKLRAEHPDWPYERVMNESREGAKKAPIGAKVDSKKLFAPKF